MSTKEMLLHYIDDLSEVQQQSLLLFLLSMTQQSVPLETLQALQEVETMKKNPDTMRFQS